MGSQPVIQIAGRAVVSYPSTSQGVQVGTADAAMRDFDIDIGLFPWLRLELSPDHLTIDGVRVEAEPAFELVVGHCVGVG